MYESPIKLTWENIDEVCKKMTLDEENSIIRCVRIQANVDVDKVELLRALQYDRGQYEKGYEDGKRDAVRHGYWIRPSALINPCCSECKQYEESGKEKPFCSECGVKMIGEMEYKMLYHSAFPGGKEQRNGQD